MAPAAATATVAARPPLMGFIVLLLVVVGFRLRTNLEWISRVDRKAIVCCRCQVRGGGAVGGSGQFWLGGRADYAIRALAELATALTPMTAEQIADAREIPKTFLTVI